MRTLGPHRWAFCLARKRSNELDQRFGGRPKKNPKTCDRKKTRSPRKLRKHARRLNGFVLKSMPLLTESGFGSLSEGPLIARGAFGVVRLCHSSSHGLCAVKTIPLPSEEAWQAAQHEARALELASGPNTVKLLGLVRLEPSSQRPIPVGLLLMEYVSGGTLSSLASSWRPTTGRGLPTGLLKRYTRCIVEAVAHVHAQGMAHRDLKGANVLLAPESQSVKLADFGSCKLPAGAAEDLAEWRDAPERIVASLVAMDAAVGMQERAHAAYATFVGVTEPLVSRQDELDRELLAALASLEQAAGQAGLGASLGKVVGEGMGAIVEAADELAAAHLTPLR